MGPCTPRTLRTPPCARRPSPTHTGCPRSTRSRRAGDAHRPSRIAGWCGHTPAVARCVHPITPSLRNSACLPVKGVDAGSAHQRPGRWTRPRPGPERRGASGAGRWPVRPNGWPGVARGPDNRWAYRPSPEWRQCPRGRHGSAPSGRVTRATMRRPRAWGRRHGRGGVGFREPGPRGCWRGERPTNTWMLPRQRRHSGAGPPARRHPWGEHPRRDQSSAITRKSERSS